MKPTFGLLMSHAVGMGARWQFVDDARQDQLRASVARAREAIAAAQPDVVVMFANDHFRSFFLDGIPAFCIGIGDEHEVPNVENSVAIGIAPRVISGDTDLATHILASVMDQGFDPAHSAELTFFDDVSVPMHHLFGRAESVPALIPIFTNCVAPPLPSFKRAHDFGVAVGRSLAQRVHDDRKIFIMATGGLSHWVGMPRTGEINEAFDQEVLDRIARGDIAEMLEWKDDDVLDLAGNGALELRNWFAALGALGTYRGSVLGYVPVAEWLTGIGFLSVKAA